MADITVGIKTLKQWGLKIWLGKHIEKTDGVFAGTDIERAQDLQKALDDNAIKAIICARGGYGTIRTLEHINWDKFIEHPKLICGFSDITVIHSFLNQNNIPALHSLMQLNFPKATNEAISSFKKALFGEELSYKRPPHAHNRTGIAEGIMTGGNVSILLALRGTELETRYDNSILFLEDVAETHYHLDRMMQNFKRSIFPRINGLVVGQFSEMKDGKTSFGKDAFGIIAEACQGFDFPVFFDFPAGHVNDNQTIWLNRPTRISVQEKGAELNFL